MKISEYVERNPELKECRWRDSVWYQHACGMMKFGPHGYSHIYDHILTPLRESNMTFVEIGISGGWSLMLWDRYFVNPETQILGIDPLHSRPKAHVNTAELHKANLRVEMFEDVRKEYSGRVKPMLVDAYSESTVSGFMNESVDVLIDDGSHHPKDKLFVVENYWRKIKQGGWLIIEDYHAHTDAEVLSAIQSKSDTSSVIVYSGFAEGRVFHGPTPEGLLCIRKARRE